MCGITGAYSVDGRNVIPLISTAAQMLQNRGGLHPQGVGISNGTLPIEKSLDPPYEFFPNISGRLSGHMGVAGLRYGTEGGRSGMVNAPPIVVGYKGMSLHIVHNGNVPYADVLRQYMERDGYHHTTTTDTESLGALWLREISQHGIENGTKKLMKELEDSAYAVVALLPEQNTLLAIQDPKNYRPLFFGQSGATYVFASEEPAIHNGLCPDFPIQKIEEIGPTQLIVVNKGGIRTHTIESHPNRSLCHFEFIYFARPDSSFTTTNGNLRVAVARYRLGEKLHEICPADVDVIVPDSESGDYVAMGFAAQAGTLYIKAMPKERFPVKLADRGVSLSQRGFMTDNLQKRQFIAGNRLLLEEFVSGKRVGYLTDSVVRGTTIGRNIELLKKMNAKEVHIRVSDPPIKYACHWGIDFRGAEELIASQIASDDIKVANEYMRQLTGADSWGYMTIEGLQEVLGEEICMKCLGIGFDGKIEAPNFLKEFQGVK
ncbi:MAG: hypothetical protein HYW26_05315 [Candidatus Aenigmarchaeota archaeon]|nr:hypothetical protein [Candidatus Aenigmarchaeota archaeon]